MTLLAIDSDGNRHRFLRGMITHDLVQRGVAFEEAYAAARAIRDQFGDRGEVTTAEIREAITGQLHKMYGDSVPSSFLGPQITTPPLQVIYHGQEQPFSRGLLARSMQAAGVDLDDVARVLAEEGVSAFTKSFEELLTTLEEKARSLRPG